jgi:GGDEF domain-containing protein
MTLKLFHVNIDYRPKTQNQKSKIMNEAAQVPQSEHPDLHTTDEAYIQATHVAHEMLESGPVPEHPETLSMDVSETGIAAEVIKSNPNILDKRDWHETVKTKVADALAQGLSVSAIFVDLDAFKLVNDRLGHDTGDAVIYDIKQLVGMVINEFRTSQKPGFDRPLDIVSVADDQPVEPINVDNEAIDSLGGHVGGDEFSILCYTDADGAKKLAERLRLHFEQYLKLPENTQIREIGVGMSIGIATADHTTTSSSDLLRRADEELNADKLARLRPLDPMERQLFDKALELLSEAKVRMRDIDKYLRKYPESEQKLTKLD